MVKTKTTSHKFTTPGGSEIECTVTRTYGTEHVEEREEEAWLDQPVAIKHPAGGELVDEYTINVSVNGEAYGEFGYNPESGRRCKNGKVIDKGHDALYRCNIRERIIIPISAEDGKIIRDLINERLTDDLSSYDVERIKEVKSALARNAVLPLAELNARRKEYRDEMLEGGEGLNPFDSYISREFTDSIIKQYPRYFK